MYRSCTTEKAALQQRKLEESLFHAMQARAYADITVSGLCEQAALSRKTFYRLFESKQDVLCALLDRAVRDFVRFSLPEEDPLLAFYAYWHQQQPLLDVLSRNGMYSLLFQRAMHHAFTEDGDILSQLGIPVTPEDPEHMLFLLSGLLTLLFTWHHNGYARSPREMAQVTARILHDTAEH